MPGRSGYDGPVDKRLEQDWLDQRPPVVAAKNGHRVGDQHCLSDDKRSGGEHEVTEGGEVLGEDEVRRKHDQVEADKKEDCRRQDFARSKKAPTRRQGEAVLAGPSNSGVS
jgi:hypothetical protein